MADNADKRTILFIEDDKQYQDAVRYKLEREGFVVLTAENGRTALEMLKKSPVDLILLDLLMPEMDGFTFCYHFANSAYKKIPIIVLTNLTDSAYNINVTDFLVKTETSLDRLLERIKLRLE